MDVFEWSPKVRCNKLLLYILNRCTPSLLIIIILAEC